MSRRRAVRRPKSPRTTCRLKGERWAEEDAKKMNTLFSNPAWMFPLMDDTPERLRGGGAGSQYWARRPGDAHQSCPV